MQIRSIISIIFSLFLVLSCKEEKDSNYKELEAYLQTFNLDVCDSCIYVFIPANQCQNCIRQNGSNLSPEMKDRVYVFSGFSEKTITNFEHFYFDKANKLMELKFLDYSNKIIRCENGKLKTNEVMTDLYGQVEKALQK